MALSGTEGGEVIFTLGKNCWRGSVETGGEKIKPGGQEISPGTSESCHWVVAKG